MMIGKADAVDGGVAQIDVGARHVDLGANHHGAFGMLAVAHFMEELQILLGRAVAVGRILARFLERATVFAHFVCSLFIHIGIARADQMLGKAEHVVEVRAREVEVRFIAELPVEAEPTDAVHDAVNILLILLDGIGVVKAHVAGAAVVTGKAEVQTDALGMADVQIAVRLRREARANAGRVGLALFELLGIGRGMPAPEAGQVGTAGQIVVDDVSNKVGDLRFGDRCFGFRRH